MRIRALYPIAAAAAVTLALPAAAAAQEVAPPRFGPGTISVQAMVERGAGCAAKAVIAFKGEPRSRARHTARMRCTEVDVRIRCASNLLVEGERTSRVRKARANRCRAAAPFAGSERYPAGTELTQRYRFRVTLKKRYQRWTGTTDECPRRSNGKRTLTCRGEQTTVAPARSVEKFSS